MRYNSDPKRHITRARRFSPVSFSPAHGLSPWPDPHGPRYAGHHHAAERPLSFPGRSGCGTQGYICLPTSAGAATASWTVKPSPLIVPLLLTGLALLVGHLQRAQDWAGAWRLEQKILTEAPITELAKIEPAPEPDADSSKQALTYGSGRLGVETPRRRASAIIAL